MTMHYTCLSLFCGLGGGALGFQRAGFRLIGGIDSWQSACDDYTRLTGSPSHCLDLLTLQPDELRTRVGERRPDVVFTSPPCVGFSGCLPARRAGTTHYIKMNSLAERGIWLMLEAWDEAPPVILLENVPRIMTRGRDWLDAITAMLRTYGYAVTESTHDCGEIGHLAQRRRRFLLIARHMRQIPEWIYEPPKHLLRGCGEVLRELPVPCAPCDTQPGGAMHALTRLSALNWLRLAAIPAGKDWRALPSFILLPGAQVDPSSTCERREGSLGVTAWDAPVHPIIGAASPQNTALQVADPRIAFATRNGTLGVTSWDDASPTAIPSIAAQNASSGVVADPRVSHRAGRQNGGYGVNCWRAPAHTVVGDATVQAAWASIADPRLSCAPRNGAYGVTDWQQESATVIGHASHDNASACVADPRAAIIPTHELLRDATTGELRLSGDAIDIAGRAPASLVIQALDGTWHRPLTTLELAVLQGLPHMQGDDYLVLSGTKADQRKKIGNAVPPPTAQAIAETIMRSLDASRTGALLMSGHPVWVQPDPQKNAGECATDQAKEVA